MTNDDAHPDEHGGARRQRHDFSGLTEITEIGRGGNAVVYRAHHERLDRTVAVKCLDSRLIGREQLRFDRECEALRTLDHHPSICRLIECRRTSDGYASIVLDYHPGGTLADAIEQRGPMSWPDALRVGAALAGALETSHRAGILHLDVTPANVLLSEHGAPVLADFGLARTGAGLTKTGELRATIEHAPPEAFAGSTPEPTNDIYSLASTMYHLIAGHAPHAKDRPPAMTLMARLAADEAPPTLDVPADVALVLERGLAKETADRYRSAGEMAFAINDVLTRHGEIRAVVDVTLDSDEPHTVVVPLPSSDASPAAARRRRGRRAVRALAAAAGVAVGVLGFTVFQSAGPDNETTPEVETATEVTVPLAPTTSVAPVVISTEPPLATTTVPPVAQEVDIDVTPTTEPAPPAPAAPAPADAPPPPGGGDGAGDGNGDGGGDGDNGPRGGGGRGGDGDGGGRGGRGN